MDVWNRVPPTIKSKCPNISSSRIFTRQKLGTLRKEIGPALRTLDHDFDLIVAGSLGRGEAHANSDVDAFVLLREGLLGKSGERQAQKLLQNLSSAVRGPVGLRMASRGAFSDSCALEDILKNIGGKKDTNDTLTRRMVLLAEAKGLGVSHDLATIKREIVKKYLQDLQPPSDRRPIFLINDLVRYYRTMCVDYEYKKNEAGKPWAVRLMKLRHSRKLFYFSCLMTLLDSRAVSPEKRVKWIQDQFINFTPLERIISVLHKHRTSRSRHWQILICYDQFLQLMASTERRKRLDNLLFSQRDKDDDYILLRDNSRRLGKLFVRLLYGVKDWRDTIDYYIIS